MPVPVGHHSLGPESVRTNLAYRAGANKVEIFREMLVKIGPWVMADAPGGKEEVRELVDPALADVIDEVEPDSTSSLIASTAGGTHLKGQTVDVRFVGVRLRDAPGRLAGTAMIIKPAPGMTVLAAIAAGATSSAWTRGTRKPSASTRTT